MAEEEEEAAADCLLSSNTAITVEKKHVHSDYYTVILTEENVSLILFISFVTIIIQISVFCSYSTNGWGTLKGKRNFFKRHIPELRYFRAGCERAG